MADEKTLDLILRAARSHGDFAERQVPEEWGKLKNIRVCRNSIQRFRHREDLHQVTPCINGRRRTDDAPGSDLARARPEVTLFNFG